MTLQSLTAHSAIGGTGFEGPNAADVDGKSILLELQSLTVSVATAGATGTCVAVTSMVATDTIKSVIKSTAGTLADATANYTAAAGGMLCASNADSNANGMIVTWFNKDGA